MMPYILKKREDIELQAAFRKKTDDYFSTFWKSYIYFEGKPIEQFLAWNKDFEAAKRADVEYQKLRSEYLAMTSRVCAEQGIDAETCAQKPSWEKPQESKKSMAVAGKDCQPTLFDF